MILDKALTELLPQLESNLDKNIIGAVILIAYGEQPEEAGYIPVIPQVLTFGNPEVVKGLIMYSKMVMEKK